MQAAFFYFAINAFSIIQLATKLQPIHIVIGAVGILVLIELCRRCVGLPILCVLGVLLVYTFYNQLSWNPSIYNALKNIIYKLFYTTSGVIGTPVSVCYTYIVLFIIFGAFLERTGIANFFISFANRLAGWSSGGPAKVVRHLFRSVRHGVRLLRGQHRDHRLGDHPHDEEDGL